MPEKRRGPLLAVYSCGHFLVDLTCAFCMHSLPGGNPLSFLIYNFCAFALQMPLGLIADKVNRNAAVAAMGLLWTVGAFFCAPVPYLCAAVLGVGNGLYHVGGGVDVLHFEREKQWMLGVFVSPGAVGLFVGSLLAGMQWRFVLPVLGALSAAVIAALQLTYSLHRPSGNPKSSLKMTGCAPVMAALCLFAVVILRAYVGASIPTPWKNGWRLSALAVAALAVGKTAGGFLADRFGAVKTAVVSLALCAVLLVFSENAVCGLLAVFLFNMTMPMTLFAMAKLFPRARGFAFGGLTFALFLGSLPKLLRLSLGGRPSVGAMMSLILLVAGLIACRERGAGA